MDRLWTAENKWTSRPQSAHTRLGQVSNNVDLPTAPWITARMDVTVTHTAHNPDYDEIISFWGKGKNQRDKIETPKVKLENRLSTGLWTVTGLTALG